MLMYFLDSHFAQPVRFGSRGPNECWSLLAVANNAGSCCVRLHVAKSLTGFKLCTTTPNNKEQHATGCANGRTMQHPTMLGVDGQLCCVRLHGVSDSNIPEKH